MPPAVATRGDAPRLERALGPVGATSLVVGGIVGASILILPSTVAREVGTPGLTLAVWLVTGLLSATGALCFAELASAIPETGGTYAFLKRAYAPLPIGFFFGWSMFFVYSTGAMAASATAVSTYIGFFAAPAAWEGWPLRATAVALLLTLTAVNVIGVRSGGAVQTALTVAKIAGLGGVVAICFVAGGGDWSRFGPIWPADRPRADVWSSIGTAMLLVLYAFNGWQFSSHVAGEVRDPQRTVPRSILVGISIVIVVYVALNAAYLYVLPFAAAQASARIAADAVVSIIGPAGGAAVALVAIAAGLGGLNAQLLNYPRIAFALARDGLFFDALSRVHPRYHTPAAAIATQAVWASAFAVSGTYQQIITYIAFVNHLFLTLAVAAVIVLRVREPDLPRPYRTIGYPITPVLFVLVSLWYLTNLLVHRFDESLVGLALMAAGVPCLLFWLRRSRRPLNDAAPSTAAAASGSAP